MNALAAISAGILLHIELKNAAEALQHFDLTKNRTEQLTTSHGVNLISDVYNSNPTAVAAVLATLKIIPATHKYVDTLHNTHRARMHQKRMKNVASFYQTSFDSLYFIKFRVCINNTM